MTPKVHAATKATPVRKSRTPEKDLRVPFPVTREADNPCLSPPLPLAPLIPPVHRESTTRCQLRSEITIEPRSPFFRSRLFTPRSRPVTACNYAMRSPSDGRTAIKAGIIMIAHCHPPVQVTFICHRLVGCIPVDPVTQGTRN